MKWLLTLLFFSTLAVGYPLVPNEDETPGSVCAISDDDFEEFRYPERIPYCHRNVSSNFKKKVYEFYSISVSERKQYTIDHLIPLSIGGDNSFENLWPEHKQVKALRPKLEMQLFESLKKGQISQKSAIGRVLRAKFYPYEFLERNEGPCDTLDLSRELVPFAVDTISY